MKNKSKALLLLTSFLISTSFTSYGHMYENTPRIVKNKTFNPKYYSVCAVRQDRKTTKSKSIEEIIKEIKQAAREEESFMKEIGMYKKDSKSTKIDKSSKSIEEIIAEIQQAAKEETEFMKEIGMYKKSSTSQKSIEEIIAEIKQALREEDEFMKEIGMYKKNSESTKNNKSSKSIAEIIAEIQQTAREETEFMKEIGASQNTFSDINSHWAKDYIEKLATKNIISGFDNNKFNPEDSMTRAQIAAILVKGLNIDINTYKNDKIFDDVSTESWYSKFAYAAYKNGLMNGFDGSFKPEKEISGEELIQIFVNAYEKNYGEIKIDSKDTTTTVNIHDWAKTAFAKAKKIGVIDKVLDPIDYKGKVKRGQVCVFIYELIK
ncbi:MAG: S-layer homology domain-containing protein [Marinisporobacter sp.]|jgi:hemerythrin|nr:S-layer homology domain-containing protein [Marinisporobacter sp.]